MNDWTLSIIFGMGAGLVSLSLLHFTGGYLKRRADRFLLKRRLWKACTK